MINLQSEFDRIKPLESYITDKGDGIIYVGGGKYWPGIAVGVKMIRMFSDIPIEIWYRGKCESIYLDDIKECENVEFYDVDEISSRLNDNLIPQGNVKSGGWEAKLYAMMHTRLSRVLYLDADAYVVKNPNRLFSYLDNNSFVFWRDLPQQMRTVKWAEVYPPGDNGVVSVQGGQLLIDRIKAWKLVHIAHFMCQHSDYYFRRMYGDQDTWRVGLAMGCCDYHIIDDAHWIGVAFQCRADDSTYIVHRCQGKLYDIEDIPPGRHKYNNPQYYIPHEEQVFNFLAEVLNNRQKDSSKVFKNIYEKKLWGNHSSASGAGSTLKEARLYLDKVNYLIQSKNWETVVDVGCGDGIVGSNIKCKKYIGIDCLPDLMKRNRVQYKKEFFSLDIYQQSDIINSGDVLVCKDVLHHWPNEWIIKWLSDLIQSRKWKAILLCQDSKQTKHSDTYLGGYRALNYRMYPLNQFPLKFIAHVHHKDLLLWERE